MGRLTRETVSITANTIDYALTTLREVTRLELTDSTGYGWADDLGGNFTSWYDEEDATPVARLRLPFPISDTTYILKAIGYAPYSVPTSSPPSSSGTLDLQPEDEWIIVAGARAYLFRRLFNQFMVFERHENENRRTSLSADQLLGLSTDAERMFQQARAEHRRRMVVGVRARPTR